MPAMELALILGALPEKQLQQKQVSNTRQQVAQMFGVDNPTALLENARKAEKGVSTAVPCSGAEAISKPPAQRLRHNRGG